MRNRLLQISALGVVSMAAPLWADENSWSGLYKGLDALDGSIDYLSISAIDADTYELRIVPSVISLCDTGRGWIIAKGKLNGDNEMLRQNGQVFCEGEAPRDVPDRVLTRDPQTAIIRYGATDDRRPLVYHKISTD